MKESKVKNKLDEGEENKKVVNGEHA